MMMPDDWREYEQEKQKLIANTQKSDEAYPEGWYEQQLIRLIERLGL